MNIRKIAFPFLLLIVSLFLFVNCDKVEEPYFKPVYTDRSVLIELIADAQTLEADVYNDFGTLTAGNPLIIPMVVLSGDTSVEGNTLLANQILSDFNLNTTDKLSMFNRDKSSGAYGVLKPNWDAHLKTELNKKGEFTLEINSDDIDSTKILNGTIKITSLNLFQNPVSLSIYILKDSIVANGITTLNVLHDSKSLFSNQKLGRGELVETSYNYDLSSFSNISNVNVLYVLTDAVTKEVLQVSKEELSYSDGGDQGYIPTFTTQQNVLIEDITGHQCLNCPKAHQELARLHNTFGDKVVGVAIHYGWQAYLDENAGFVVDYQTTVGTAIADEFAGVSVPLPFGFVNRVNDGTDRAFLWGEWDAEVSRLTAIQAKVGINIDAEIDNTTLDVTVYVKAFEQLDTLIKVQGFITESHLHSKQKYYEAPWEIEDYEQNHVLRASINGTWGEDLTATPFLSDQVVNKHYSFPLSSEWNHDNLSLVIIIYNDISKEIIQVQEKHLD